MAQADGSQASPQGRQLIALLAALLTRAFLNEQTSPVTLRRSPQALALLRAVFRPLGQVAPLELGSKPQEVEQTLARKNFSGFPLYATAPQDARLEKIRYPLLLLGESGIPFEDPLDGAAAQHTASLSYQVLSSLALNLVREAPEVHGVIRGQSATNRQDLFVEGKRVIEARCGLGNFDLLEPQLPCLHRVLAQIPQEQLRAYFRSDRVGGTIRILCRKLKGVTRQPLYNELVLQNPAVRRLGDHYILCPADWFRPLLEHYYGTGISLSPAKVSVNAAESQTPTV